MVNVAIIGAGIGGCSAAYFAQKYLANSKVTTYELEKRIGGRLLTFNKGGPKKELGAEFFNSSNKLVCSLVDEISLKVKRLTEIKDIAVWNGTEITFKSSQQRFYNFLSQLGKYKHSVPKLLLALREADAKIKQMYEKQENNPAELWEFFESVGLDQWYKMPFDKILSDLGVKRKFIDELITPITRIIYSQNAGLGGFAGLSSLLGVFGGSVYRLADGNDTLPCKLLEASNSKVELESKVDHITKTSKDSFRIFVRGQYSVFDAVVIATPLEVADIVVEGVEKKWEPREYQKIYIRLMKGVVNSKYFNLDSSSKLPSIILTSKETDPITRFSLSSPTKGDESWVAITSTKPLSNVVCDELFKNGKTVLDHTWTAAYPIFKPTQKIPPTCLDNKLLYLNSIESAASSLESSTFAALNSIKMIKKQNS